jgi:hypothetical protein
MPDCLTSFDIKYASRQSHAGSCGARRGVFLHVGLGVLLHPVAVVAAVSPPVLPLSLSLPPHQLDAPWLSCSVTYLARHRIDVSIHIHVR